MQVLGKFNLSEDPSGDVLTVRPIAVSGMLRVTFGFSGTPLDSEKQLSVYRSATKSVEQTFAISESLTSVEFIPQGNVKYLLRLTYDEAGNDCGTTPAPSDVPAAAPAQVSAFTGSLDDFDASDAPPAAPPPAAPEPPQTPASPKAGQPSGASDPEYEKTQADIQAAEEKLRSLRERRESAKDILKKLEAEYEKDYDEFGRELEEIRQQYGVDQSVTDYYRDFDIQPIEQLFKEISDKLEQAEKQISLVILGRQQKTMEIEKEVKSNKRQ